VSPTPTLPSAHTHTRTQRQQKNQTKHNQKIKQKNYSASELRSLLGGLGPSFVKIGQALSARPDLLPAPYLRALSDLQVSW
jgi:predicted unusual protein kinase regulating ubiquinone biosynthesis (AarF/ABC1/UbiB family)